MLCWNVYVGNFNSGEIGKYNIFNHYSFYNDCVKAKKKYKDDRDGFEDEVRRSLMYYFWSKCEWEIILDHWPNGERYELRKKISTQKLYDAFNAVGEGYSEDKLISTGDRRYEIRVFPENNRFLCRKIDVYSQVLINWENFIEYLWNHRNELKVRK